MRINLTRFLSFLFLAALALGTSGCAKPEVNVRVSRNQIQQGEDVQVSWTSKNAKEVTLNGQTVDSTGAKIFNPDSTTTYTADARRGKKLATSSRTVAVTPRPAQPTISLTATPGAIQKGQNTTLQWNATNSDSVNISGLGTVPSSGSRTLSPPESTTYTGTASGPGGSATASTRITVTEPAPPATPAPTTATRPAPAPPIKAVFEQWVQPVFFDFDKSDLRPEAREALRRAALWLTREANRTIAFRIEGHCDPLGTEEYNIGLGERRAQAAREFLVSLGIEPSRIQTVSYGEARAQGSAEGSPTAPPSWAHDRRDEFVYITGGTAPRP